jgi:hypothetical protein
MIIWSGLGIVVALIVFVCLLAVEALTETAFADSSYYQIHGWPKLLGFLLAAAAVWGLNDWLEKRPGKVVIEKDTGREIVLKPRHALFFVPMRYWPYILCALGLVFLFIRS